MDDYAMTATCGKCGAVCGIVADNEDARTADVVAEWLGDGLTVTRMPLEDAKAAFSVCTCGCVEPMTSRPVWPGRIVQRELDARGWTVDDLAEQSGVNVLSLKRLLGGNAPIRYQTAAGLALAFGTSTELWYNLQANYNRAMNVRWVSV